MLTIVIRKFVMKEEVILRHLVLLLMVTAFCIGDMEQDGSWYKGCFTPKFDLLEYPSPKQANLTECSEKCMIARLSFLAIQADSCLCLDQLDLLESVSATECDTRCKGTEDKNLPCGGVKAGAWSVYTAAGPYIESIVPQEIVQWIEPGIPVTLQTTVFLHSFVDITEEPLIKSDWENRLEFLWQSEFTVVGVNISANSSQEHAVCTLTFPNTGNFSIEMQARNLLSTVSVRFTVTVVIPKPRDIQVTPLNDPRTLPSCIPPAHHLESVDEDFIDHSAIHKTWKDGPSPGQSPVVAVFANTTFILEVSVSTGIYLIFDISIWNGSSWKLFQHVPHQGKDKCLTPYDCRSVNQEYVFTKTGVYKAFARVSNEYGNVEKDITIVVMDQHIRDLAVELDDPSYSIVRPGKRLIFNLTAITADRQNTFIRVNFNDSIEKTAAVRERQNGSNSGLPTLLASYGDGCNLSLRFDHVYEKQGVFVPKVELFNNIFSAVLEIETPITVLNEIEGLKLQAEPFGPIGKPIHLSVTYTSISVNVTALWTIFDETGSLIINETTKRLDMSVVFTKLGRFKIGCTVSNRIHSRTAVAHIVIQEPVGKVSIFCDQGPYVEIEKEVNCKAVASSGTSVSFDWDFQENAAFTETISENGSSVASHIFMYPGIYNISVSVHNKINTVFEQLPYRIFVEIPIACLNVITTSPSLPGKSVNIVATATRGTSLTFDLDVGRGKTAVSQEVEVNGDTTIFSVGWVFDVPGKHNVTINAYNHISKAARSVDVLIQESPPEFKIHILPTPVASFRTLALTTTTGELLDREDLVFKFVFSDGATHVTQVPVVTREIHHINPRGSRGPTESDDIANIVSDGTNQGRYPVDVVIRNGVGQEHKTIALSGTDSDFERNERRRKKKKRRRRRKRPILWHPSLIRANELTSFLLANKSRGISAVHIDYGDGSKENVSCLSDSCSWGRKFQVPGVFALDVSLYGRRPSRKDQALRSVLVVEEPIKGLQLLGSTDVGIECDQDWYAKLDTGSHLIYIWSLDGVPEEPTTNNKYVVGFAESGTHTLQVNVSNDLSSSQASMSFSVKHAIVNVILNIPPNIVGLPANISLLIEGGREFSVFCSFGDGQTETYLSESLSLVEIVRENSAPAGYPRNSVPMYKVLLRHIYKKSGDYNVTVTVTNGVSEIHCSHIAVVEEAIGIVTVATDNSQVIAVGDEFVVTAKVSSGRNLKFSWDFSYNIPPTVHSDGNTSVASHVFDIPDKYIISVTVSNHLQKEGITVNLPYPLEVVAPLSMASITHVFSPGYPYPQNTAVLLFQDAGQLGTQEVVFKAKSGDGGSAVQFTFDFGDGHSTTVNGIENTYLRMVQATATHIYTEEGVFDVRLTASNPLGNITVSLGEPFYVQIPPSGLKMEVSEKCVQFGELIKMNASVEAGTNVSFTWKLDDQTELIDEGSYVEHQYRRIGKENIQVTAANEVDSVSDHVTVQIAEKILGVNLSVSDPVIIAGQPTNYVATIYPPSAHTDSWYEWEFSPSQTILYDGNITYAYSRSGRHHVMVNAGNCLGSVRSTALQLHVVAKLKGLTITVEGDAIVSSPVHLKADYWQGDSLTFTWDFGDGNSFNTTSSGISHNYSQIGEYTVELLAENPVSKETVIKKLFILDQPCEQPELTILGAQKTVGPMDQNELEFLHSEPINIESEMRVNCTISSQVTFKWDVMDMQRRVPVNLRVPWAMGKKINKHLESPALLLPSWTLTTGKYLVRLHVEINGTKVPVYSEAEAHISVLPTPLVSIIHGGIYRHAGQHNIVQLDGRGSGLVGNSSADLEYLWACTPLSAKGDECFETPHQVPLMNASQLSFPASWLTSNFSEFLFNLTIFKVGEGDVEQPVKDSDRSAVSSQVIKLQPENDVVDLLLECPQCWRNMVNGDRKISLRTHCPKCKGPLTYRWKISALVGGDNDRDDIHNLCVFANGSSYLQLIHGSNPNATVVTKMISTAKPFVDAGDRVPISQSSPVLITEVGQSRLEYRRGERRSRLSSEDFFPDPAEDESQGSRRRHNFGFPTDDIKEGLSPGRNSGTGGVVEDPHEEAAGGRVTTNGGDITPDSESVGKQLCITKGDPDCLAQNTPPSPPPLHLVSRDRVPFFLTSEQTLTGLDQPSLVIKPGVLKQGSVYFVQVNALAQDGSSGLAMTYFEVNESPRKGRCSVRPQEGIQMKTVFSVFCNAWQDEQLPLRYEVSYILEGSPRENAQIVYHGLRHKISFKLPSGLASHNYKVLLHIAVLDRLGAKTLICRIPIEVRPTNYHAESRASDLLDLLHNEAALLQQLASQSIYNGVSHDLFGPLTQVASSLNAHGAVGHMGHSDIYPRALETRQTILKTLGYMPMRDEIEVIQALRCLAEATDHPKELNETMLLDARALLKDISREAQILFAAGKASGHSRGLNPRVLPLAVWAVSNILISLNNSQALFNVSSKLQKLYKSITDDDLQVINSLIELELQYHSIGEIPVSVKDRFLSLNASHYSVLHLSPLAMEGVLFQLPSSLKTVLNRNYELEKEGNDGRENHLIGYEYHQNLQCFQARAMSFPVNPFALVTKGADMVQSELASLDIFNCFGNEKLNVRGLPKDDMIQIVIPKKAGLNTTTTVRKHYLDKMVMSVHQLNATLSFHNYESSRNEDQFGTTGRYLHVHIEFDPVTEGHSFPVMVIISSHSPPQNLKKYIHKQQYDRDINEIKIFLSPGSIEGGQHYYIGLVEASFNSGRRRSNEVEGRNYTLSTWWGTCVYWNRSVDMWLSDGCQVMPTSSVDALHCRCNHLTTFGGYFELIPNDLSFVNVDEFFSLHENPVVIILVGTVLLLYILLVLILRQSDIHDSKKGNCIYLQDNTVSHHQKYEVVMETGFNRDAGTTSRISIILHGEEGMSETRELISDDNCPMFERNSRDRFIVTLPDSLGRIFKIQLWHNNSGSSPGWFLRQVVVRDLSAGQAFYFLCQKWLAVDRDDGKVEREFTAVDGKNISFGMIFWCKGSQYLTDFHTWMSVWTCPPHSRFTRVQRLTVCFTLLMGYMCLSTMWFKQASSHIRGEFGLLDLSWHNIVVGFISCAVVIPLNLFLSFLFRRSRVHYPGYEQDKALMSGKSGGEFMSEGEEELPQPAVTYSILDQSILNWQNIQDWAQKQWLKRQQSVRSSANSVKTTQTSPQPSAPSTAPLVQQTMLAEDDTDQGSSGFEDATSQATAERHRIKATSDISSDGKKSRNVEQTDLFNASRRIFLPFWFRYVAWVLCFLISCACGTITIMYGFRFGHTKSVMWVQSVYFSFMLCLFIAQPFMILMCVIYTAICHHDNPAVFDHYDDGFYGERIMSGAFHKQQSHSSEEDEDLQRGVAARSRSRYLRFAGPPQEKQLKHSRKKLVKHKRAMLLLRDSLWFTLMIVLVCIIAFGKDSRAPYFLNNSMKQAFFNKQINNTSLLKLNAPSDWYRWSQSVLVDTLYSQTSLGNGQGELGYIIGSVLLRQLRIRPEPCHNFHYLEWGRSCLYSYNFEKRDISNSGKPWSFSSTPNKNINPGIWGQAAWYDTSGHVMQLNRSRKEAVKQLRILEAQNWIDLQTRAVFVEMTFFNVPTKLFSSVTLLLELTPSGKTFTSAHIMSTYVFRYITLWDNWILGCELLFIVFAMWMFFHEVKQMIKSGKTYFHHFWNYIELLMCTVSLLYTGAYIFRFILVSEAVEFMRSTFYEEFISLSFLTLWDEFLRDLVAVILFCIVIKFLQILRYHQIFWRLQSVYRRCKMELLLAAVVYGGLIMAFSSLSTGLFGSVVYCMRSLWSSILAMSALSVRDYDSPNERTLLSTYSCLPDIVLMFSFTFCHGFVVTYIFTVLANRLKKTKNRQVLAMSGGQLLAFYWDKILKWTGSRAEASHEQTDNTLPPEFTMAEILYLVEELLFRMNALLGTSGLPDKRHSFTDSDSTPNGGDDGISSGGSEDRHIPVTTTIAVEGARLEQRVQKIEDKLCSNEPYLAQLLKLDSIGTDILSEEKEKELRSHLEFEIFRQLQMQRQESTVFDVQNQPYMACSVLEPVMNLKLPTSKTNGPSSLVKGQNADEIATAQDNKPVLNPALLKSKDGSLSSAKTSPDSSSSGQESPQDIRSTQEVHTAAPMPVLLLPPKRSQSLKVPGKQAGGYRMIEALKTQKQWLDLSTTNEKAREAKMRAKYLKVGTGASVPRYPDYSKKKDGHLGYTVNDKKLRGDPSQRQDCQMSLRSGVKSKDPYLETSGRLKDKDGRKQEQTLGLNLSASAQNPSSGNVSPQSSESERGHKRTDSSSGQSGHERNDTPKMSNRRPELPPKPTFAHGILLPVESGKSLTGWSPKPKQFTFLPELMSPVGAESSSGSEQEATLSSKRTAQGRRNLRKTKSRGKGKGNEASIASPMSLGADFASSGQSGSDFDIIIHPIPSGIDPDDNIMPEEYMQ